MEKKVETKQGKKKEMEAYVVSDKMTKTVVVQIKKRVQHPIFKKYYTVRKKYKAHDEENTCKIGDKVLIRESKPLSREKRWVVVKILEKAAA
jgi:small subunit ribosomal protein S17